MLAACIPLTFNSPLLIFIQVGMGKDPKRRSKRVAAAETSEVKSESKEPGGLSSEASSEAHAEATPSIDSGKNSGKSDTNVNPAGSWLNPAGSWGIAAGSWGIDSSAQRPSSDAQSSPSFTGADHRGSSPGAWQNDPSGRSHGLRGGKAPKGGIGGPGANQATALQWQSWSGGSTARGWG